MKITVQICAVLLLAASSLWAADVQNNTNQQIQVTSNLAAMSLAFAENRTGTLLYVTAGTVSREN